MLVAQEIMKLHERMSITELSDHFGLQERTIKIIISQNEKRIIVNRGMKYCMEFRVQ